MGMNGLGKGKGGMSFRYNEYFNQAMLAKQGWRLLKFPNSLMAQVVKAKYYPRGNFLEANMGSCPSYAWRSIWKARKLLKEGLIWRVGDGLSINIWRDRWIPSPITNAIHSPNRILPIDAKVCCLFDKGNQGWNVPLLKELFSSEEVA
jgi:hypothetical protein